MPFYVGAACIDVMDRSCTEVCPVDCIYVGDRKVYINPVECIDCGACEPVCPETAIKSTRSEAPDPSDFRVDNARFFTEPLPQRPAALGNPGGSLKLGEVGVDTPLVDDWPTA